MHSGDDWICLQSSASTMSFRGLPAPLLLILDCSQSLYCWKYLWVFVTLDNLLVWPWTFLISNDQPGPLRCTTNTVNFISVNYINVAPKREEQEKYQYISKSRKLFCAIFAWVLKSSVMSNIFRSVLSTHTGVEAQINWFSWSPGIKMHLQWSSILWGSIHNISSSSLYKKHCTDL